MQAAGLHQNPHFIFSSGFIERLLVEALPDVVMSMGMY